MPSWKGWEAAVRSFGVGNLGSALWPGSSGGCRAVPLNQDGSRQRRVQVVQFHLREWRAVGKQRPCCASLFITRQVSDSWDPADSAASLGFGSPPSVHPHKAPTVPHMSWERDAK